MKLLKIAFYIALFVVSFSLYINIKPFVDFARGYFAHGGEIFILALPVLVFGIKTIFIDGMIEMKQAIEQSEE